MPRWTRRWAARSPRWSVNLHINPFVTIMKTIRQLTVLLLASGILIFQAAHGATPSQVLQQGLYAEEVEGNIDAAIKTYDQVIRNNSAPPAIVAQALYRQGMCYLKLKD